MGDTLLKVLKQWGKILLESFLYLIILFAIGLALTGVITAISPEVSEGIHTEGIGDPYKESWISYFPMIVGALVALYIVHVVIFKREFRYTGFLSTSIIAGITRGAVLALLMLGIGFIILWIFDGLRIDSAAFNGYLFFGFLLFFIIQSSFEEIVSRAFLIPTIERRSNVWAAIGVSSLLFAILHAGNPNISYFALLNICLAGILLGFLFVRYRSIWPAIGLHVFWNFLQGSFFGFEVSGMEVYSYINITETGNDLITGGSFGYEGSLLGALGLIIASYFVWKSDPQAFQTLPEYANYEENLLPLA